MVWLRLFVCQWSGCQRGVLLCTSCDRYRYCRRECALAARKLSLREAGAKYQSSDRGREHHAVRQRRYVEDKRRTSCGAGGVGGSSRGGLHHGMPAGNEVRRPEGRRRRARTWDAEEPLASTPGVDSEPAIAAFRPAAFPVDAADAFVTHQRDSQRPPPWGRVDMAPAIAATRAAPTSGAQEQRNANREREGEFDDGGDAGCERSGRVTVLRCARCQRVGRLLPRRERPAPGAHPP